MSRLRSFTHRDLRFCCSVVDFSLKMSLSLAESLFEMLKCCAEYSHRSTLHRRYVYRLLQYSFACVNYLAEALLQNVPKHNKYRKVSWELDVFVLGFLIVQIYLI